MLNCLKFFDRVRLKDVNHILYNGQIFQDSINTMEDRHDNITQVRIEEKLTETIDIGAGIRQGNSLGLLLFNLLIDEIKKIVK